MALNEAVILDAALALIDEQGAQALSMRKLGARLGVQGMAIYRYYPNKEALLQGVKAKVLAPLGEVETTGQWRDDATALAQTLRDCLFAHPNAISMVADGPAEVPMVQLVLKRSMQTLVDDGFSGLDAAMVLQSTFEFTLGHALFHRGPTILSFDGEQQVELDNHHLFSEAMEVILNGFEDRSTC